MGHSEVDESPVRGRFAGSRRRRWLRPVVAASALLIAGTLALAGCSAGGSGDTGGAVPEIQPDEDAVDGDRAVIITGDMAIVVTDVADAAGDAVRIASASGGRVDGREESGDPSSATAMLILRIPAAALEDAIDDLRGLGEVGHLRTEKTDVTTEVQDIDAHVAALRSTIARLQGFQAGATTVADLLAIESEIADRQAELEGYLTQQSDYAERIDLSTLTLTLSSQPLPSTAPDSFWSGLGVGWNALMTFLGGLVIVIGVMLPWLLGLGLIAALIVLLIRLLRRRRTPKPPQGGGPGAPPFVPPAPDLVGAASPSSSEPPR